MSKKIESLSAPSKQAQGDAGASVDDAMAYIPELTPEQWAWIRAQTRELQENYVPSRSLIPGV